MRLLDLMFPSFLRRNILQTQKVTMKQICCVKVLAVFLKSSAKKIKLALVS